MRLDFVLSFALHFVIIMAMVISAPFKPKIKTDLSDVINVRLASLPVPAVAELLEPIVIPRAIEASEELAFIPDMKTIDKAKVIKKTEKKPKDKKPYKPDVDKGPEAQAGIDSEKNQKDVSENLEAGSTLGGAAIDNVSFDYPYWFVQTFPKIERNWRNPVFANRPLKCIVYFQVIRSGRVIKIEIEESSGIDAYDRACMQAVKRCQNLPPLPKEFADEILGIHLEFPYSPR